MLYGKREGERFDQCFWKMRTKENAARHINGRRLKQRLGAAGTTLPLGHTTANGKRRLGTAGTPFPLAIPTLAGGEYTVGRIGASARRKSGVLPVQVLIQHERPGCPGLPRVVVPGGGRSPISRTADAAPGGSLSARGDNGVNVVKCIGSV